MKSIKVSDKAQQELKVYAAKAQLNMSDIASEGILRHIKHLKVCAIQEAQLKQIQSKKQS